MSLNNLSIGRRLGLGFGTMTFLLMLLAATAWGVWFGGFVFSSRRRHTSGMGDWSSDVCSSDLLGLVGHSQADIQRMQQAAQQQAQEIGRASCRERV